jgi:energy-converting hydrogenase Eha subunit C
MVHIIGGFGTILVVGAYFLVSSGKIASRSLSYQGMNLTGAVLLTVYGFLLFAWATVALNVIWGVIALVALYRVGASRRKARPGTDR